MKLSKHLSMIQKQNKKIKAEKYYESVSNFNAEVS